MRILIFGCGYLGKRVALARIAAGDTVSAMTRSEQNAESFRAIGIQPLIGDVCAPMTLNGLPHFDAVLHAIGFDRNSGRTQREVTYGGMRNVLDAIGQRGSRFLHISSSSVYGQSEGEWVDEESACEPTQPGGSLNFAAEQLVRDHFAVATTQATVLRLAGIYGPGRLLSRIESMRAGTPIAGSGDSWLNLIHVDDAVTAIVKSLEADSPSRTYNVVDDHPIERRDYYGLLAKLIGAPAPTFDTNQPGARGSGGLNKRCSNRKLREELGWKPTYSSIALGLPAALGSA
jgi:nucleoside-diphosphate-sugar epimerase